VTLHKVSVRHPIRLGFYFGIGLLASTGALKVLSFLFDAVYYYVMPPI
jgi:hypothetical protein